MEVWCKKKIIIQANKICTLRTKIARTLILLYTNKIVSIYYSQSLNLVHNISAKLSDKIEQRP